MAIRLKGCTKCKGDLIWSDYEWTCCQCGRTYYTEMPEPNIYKRKAASSEDSKLQATEN
ncbi:MAG: hypothetical protein MK029_03625 [Dehalococcoidia bacterium]|nr:hypothetical protein [Dehalococcoidia bacterium]